MTGGELPTSTAAAVMALIMLRDMCLDCIVEKTGLRLADASQALDYIGSTVKVTTRPGRCEACDVDNPVFRIA